MNSITKVIISRNFCYGVTQPSRNIQGCLTQHALQGYQSIRFKTYKRMEQIEVDESKVQDDLGKIRMTMIRKAEKSNRDRTKL